MGADEMSPDTVRAGELEPVATVVIAEGRLHFGILLGIVDGGHGECRIGAEDKDAKWEVTGKHASPPRDDRRWGKKWKQKSTEIRNKKMTAGKRNKEKKEGERKMVENYTGQKCNITLKFREDQWPAFNVWRYC